MFITNHFKSILAGLGMCLLAFNVSAYPQLKFDGSMTYGTDLSPDAPGGIYVLSVNGTLTGSQDISPAPQLSGSTFSFGGLLDSVSAGSYPSTTLARFTGISGPDLKVIDGDSNLLLQGELAGLAMSGLNDANGGVLMAQFTPTGGSLLNEFAVGAKLVALQFNLTTTFGPKMFDHSFKGGADGNLSAPAAVSVPEPGVLVLFMLGLGMLVMATSKKSGQKFSHHVS